MSFSTCRQVIVIADTTSSIRLYVVHHSHGQKKEDSPPYLTCLQIPLGFKNGFERGLNSPE